MPGRNLTLSIVIATKDRRESLIQCLQSILSQSVLPETIIIVDAGRDEHLKHDLLSRLKGGSIELVYIRSTPGLTRQRNIGIGHNQNDLVMFLDDDVILKTDYIKEIKKIFEMDKDGLIGGVTGKIINMRKFNFISQIIRKIFFLPEISRGEVKISGANNAVSPEIEKPIEVDWLSGCNQTYRKAVFEEHLFDENLGGYSYMEDVDFSYRVGQKFKLIYDPRALLLHNKNMFPDTRMKTMEKQKMYMIHYYYFFKKNLPQTWVSNMAHVWSYIGLLVRGLVLERRMAFIIGTLQGMVINLLEKNSLVKKLNSEDLYEKNSSDC